MNSADTTSCMKVLSGAYPNLTVTDETVLLWAEAFATTPTHTVTAALRLWIEQEQWPPTIAGINQKMREVLAAQQRSQDKERAYSPRELPSARWLTFEEGRKVAAYAYAEECQQRGVEPSWDYWEKAMNVYGKPGR
jgi:hypothetical protein